MMLSAWIKRKQALPRYHKGKLRVDLHNLFQSKTHFGFYQSAKESKVCHIFHKTESIPQRCLLLNHHDVHVSAETLVSPCDLWWNFLHPRWIISPHCNFCTFIHWTSWNWDLSWHRSFIKMGSLGFSSRCTFTRAQRERNKTVPGRPAQGGVNHKIKQLQYVSSIT